MRDMTRPIGLPFLGSKKRVQKEEGFHLINI